MSTAAPSSVVHVAAAIYASDAAHVREVLDLRALQGLGSRWVIGGGGPTKVAAEAAGATWIRTVADLVEQVDSSITHVWLLHDDALPRPDALEALLQAAEQIDASLVGSKVLDAADPTVLESVGGATDVFLVPDTGLTAGELDQEQYDVVRDVAFVPGASLLIRRDLLKGLGGPDALLPPIAQSVDFASRARLAGARVAVVPSSEVLHRGTCREAVAPWRESAARWRAATKLYSALTATWVLPMALIIAIADAAGRLLMGQVAPFVNLGRAIGWNMKHVAGTISARTQARRIAAVGDGELFRYQLSGSLLVRSLGSDITEFFRTRAEQLHVEERLASQRMFWQQPGFTSVVLAFGFIALGLRNVLFSGLGVSGYSLQAAAEPFAVLTAFGGGWNSVGFGSMGPGHPAAAMTALFQLLVGDGVMVVVTVLSVVAAFFGFRRWLSVLGVRGVAGAAGALAGVGGFGVEALGDHGYWAGLPAVAAVSWVLVGTFGRWPTVGRSRLSKAGWVVLVSAVAVSYVPATVAIPAVVAGAWAVFGFGRRRKPLIRSVVLPVVSLGVLGPWLWWLAADDLLTAGDALVFSPPLWLVIGLGAGVLLVTMFGGDEQAQTVGIGGLLFATGMVVARLAPGLELSVAALVLVSVSLVLIVGGSVAALDPSRGVSRVAVGIGQVGVVVAFVTVGLAIGSGDWHFSDDRYTESLAFSSARASGHGPDRLLFVGADVPGQSREIDGVPYRVGTGALPLSEAWLGPFGAADQALEGVLREAQDPAQARPGAALADLGIRWVVVSSPSVLDVAFEGKLDLKELPIADPNLRVFEFVGMAPIARAVDGTPWASTAASFIGEPSPEVLIAVNPVPFAQDVVPVVLDGTGGEIGAETDATMRVLGWLAAALLALSFGAFVQTAVRR